MPVTSDLTGQGFIETKQHRRFQEFCDACRRYQYIGLCYGPPGVGKTLSARHYANRDTVERYRPDSPGGTVTLEQVKGSAVVFYTSPVVVTSHWREFPAAPSSADPDRPCAGDQHAGEGDGSGGGSGT